MWPGGLSRIYLEGRNPLNTASIPDQTTSIISIMENLVRMAFSTDFAYGRLNNVPVKDDRAKCK